MRAWYEYEIDRNKPFSRTLQWRFYRGKFLVVIYGGKFRVGMGQLLSDYNATVAYTKWGEILAKSVTRIGPNGAFHLQLSPA